MIDRFAHEPPVRRRLLQLLTWTWCLPTTLVGLVAGLFTVAVLSGRASPYFGATVVRSPRLRRLGGVCLGPVILLTDHATPELVAHEWGHFRQHLRLGPLYLLVIGVPSAVHALWHRLRGGAFPEYFHFWTEAWADHLGGVYDRHAHRHARWTGYALGPLLTVILGALTLRAFGPALTFPFTDADALVDVAWARFPLRDQLLVPLTGGLGAGNANFWRPAAMVQFWALRHVFGEEPAGWHAWSLLLHVVSAVMVGLLLEGLLAALREGGATSRDRWSAALGAGLYAVHPLAEEVVPATARSLDLLLGVGFFGALLALVRGLVARREGRSDVVARALFFAFAVLALASKEAGALLLPIAAGWIVLLDAGEGKAAGASRLRTSARLLGPFAIATVGFLVVRARVLGGLGGYRESDAFGDAGLLSHALQRGFLEPLVSSLSGALAPLEGAPGGALAVAIWAALLWGLRRHARLLALLAVFYVPWIVLLGLTGTYSRRVLYVPTFAMAAVLALAIVEVGRGVWGGARVRSPGPVMGIAPLTIVTLALCGAWLHGTPALRRYADWGAVGRAATPLLDPDVWAPIPDGATVWLVDRPTRVDVDPRRYRLWSRRKSLNNGATTYSLEAWVDEHVPRGLTLRTLTSITPEGLPDAYAALVVAAPDRVQLSRPPVPRAITRGGDMEVTESADGVVVITTASDQSEWVMVWNPRFPIVAAVRAAARPPARDTAIDAGG